MKTIAHILPTYNPFPPQYPAGTELRVEQVCLRQQRYRGVVICGGFDDQPAHETIGRMAVERVHIGRVYRRLFQKITRFDPYPYVDRVAQRIQQQQASLIHIHNEPKLLSGLATFLQRTALPTVVHVANEKPLPEARIKAIPQQWIACSDYIANWLINHNGIAANRVRTLYTGVDTTRLPWWQRSEQTRAAYRVAAGVPAAAHFVIGFAGRLVQEKGVQELLDAFAQVYNQLGPTVHLLVAGNVRESNDPRNQKAVYGRAVTERMATMPGVTWVGSLHPASMHDFLCACDLFAMPSLWHDPFPTVMLEAAAAGIPIVAGRRGGISEFLQQVPELGLLDEPGDSVALAQALISLLADPDRCLRIGHTLRQMVEQDYTWERVTAEFEQVYDTIL
ncbi:glycosyltransferase family 4 protein [Parvibium lacunae]|uniref:Glycosyltransferase family 1 protein n=1 Tax=Parvibium lacunae TaxID=1888893 RepID=A0A368L587_9BURK|nr:glycosyltransferase family 4 protein [Parvibium lacunae]RCS58310.1 glycosyltransferase family 1 protein [Parvibium lacunae]